MMDKKQRNAIMRSRNRKPLSELTNGDYYHKQSAHTIMGWLLVCAAIAIVICAVVEVLW